MILASMSLVYRPGPRLTIFLLLFLLITGGKAFAGEGSSGIEVYSAGERYTSVGDYRSRQVVSSQEQIAVKPAADAPSAGTTVTVAGIKFDPSQGKTVTLSPGGAVTAVKGVGRPDLGLSAADLTYDPEKGKTLVISPGPGQAAPAVSAASSLEAQAPADLRVPAAAPAAGSARAVCVRRCSWG